MLSLLFIALVVYTNASWVPEMENAGLFEGDMVLTPDQKKLAEKGKLGYALKVGGQWPRGEIAWEYGSASQKARGAIRQAVNILNGVRCLRFKERTNERAYITFFTGQGCYSYVGYTGGAMRISIGQGCERDHIVVHEILHALGMYHEQSRKDRDQYLKINWQNIKQGMENNFRISQDTNSMGSPYDYASIMHYASNAFSKNGQPTMVRMDGRTFGRNTGLSSIDREQITLYYKNHCAGGGGGPGPITQRPPRTNRPPPGGCRDIYNRCRPDFCSTSYWKSQCLKTCGCPKL